MVTESQHEKENLLFGRKILRRFQRNNCQ